MPESQSSFPNILQDCKLKRRTATSLQRHHRYRQGQNQLENSLWNRPCFLPKMPVVVHRDSPKIALTANSSYVLRYRKSSVRRTVRRNSKSAPARAGAGIPHRPEREKLNRETALAAPRGTAEIRPVPDRQLVYSVIKRNLCGATGSHQQGRRDRQQDRQLVPVPPVSMRTVQSTLAYPCRSHSIPRIGILRRTHITPA